MSARHVREMLRVTATNSNICTTLYEFYSTRSRHCSEFWRVVLLYPKPALQFAVLSLKKSWLHKPERKRPINSNRGPSLPPSPQLQREGPILKDLRLASVDLWLFESIKIFRVKLTEIVILWVYYTIPFCFSLIYHFWDITFQLFNYFVWIRITDEGPVPEMLIWPIYDNWIRFKMVYISN